MSGPSSPLAVQPWGSYSSPLTLRCNRRDLGDFYGSFQLYSFMIVHILI